VADQAVQYWLKAGQRAWQRSAAKEAIAHLSSGLELIDRIADPATRDALELRLQAALGVVYFATVSYAAPQAQAAFLRAYELTERVKQPELLAQVLYGIGAFQTMKGNVRAGHEAFEKLMSVATQSAQPRLLLYAQAALAWSNYNRADYAAAIEHANRVLALYESVPQAGPRLSAADPKVISECFRALALWSLGFPDQADRVSDALLAHARALGDPYSLAYALNFAALLIPDLRGEYQRADERAEEGIGLARELGYPFMELSGTLWRVWPASHLFGPAELVDVKDQGLEKCRALGIFYHYPQLLARRARLLIRLGRVEEAQGSAAQALALIEASGEGAIEADAQLAAGQSWQAAGPAHGDHAQSCYLKALDVARRQQAKGWELRAAIALARLWQLQGKREQPRGLLAPIYRWFTEGHDTADLREAAGLLRELE
jgi:tetratricopeptide (TPR) repeat protein